MTFDSVMENEDDIDVDQVMKSIEVDFAQRATGKTDSLSFDEAGVWDEVNTSKPLIKYFIIWALRRENLSSEVCKQQRCRPACAFAQTDSAFVISLFDKYHIVTCYNCNFNFLASL